MYSQLVMEVPTIEETIPVTEEGKPEETAPILDSLEVTEAEETREDILDEATLSETSPVISAGN